MGGIGGVGTLGTTAIEVENSIRKEHSTEDDNLGMRDGSDHRSGPFEWPPF
jgi:hypothetical protein